MFLQRQAVLTWLFVALLGLTLISVVEADVNITLEDTAAQITYSPPACGLTLASAGTETQGQICDSAWRIITAPDASGGTLTTTSGPTDGSGGLIPQLFLSVRALALHVKTSAASNAIVNVSVSTSNPIVTVRSELNSSLRFISIIGLPEETVTTLSLTFVESNLTTTLGIDTIAVTISDNNIAPFVSPSLPPPTSLPTVTPSIVIPNSGPGAPSSPSGQTSGDIAAEVLGAVMGAVLIASGVFFAMFYYRKRRRPAQSNTEEKADT
ncbi:hypothetical protein BD413DRAFT_164173 [Trametes elegans]|nr:hypothetical protein BD413DRAFT_164173 [Trametes elegans]